VGVVRPPDQYDCFGEPGTKINPRDKSPVNLYYAQGTSETISALVSMTNNPSAATANGTSSAYPPVIMVMASASVSQSSGEAMSVHPFRISRDTLITGPLDGMVLGTERVPSQLPSSGGSNTSVVLNLANLPDIFVLRPPTDSSSTRVSIFLQHLVLDGAIIQDLSINTVQRSALPLWAFKLPSRTSPQLFLSSVTLVLAPLDFIQIYRLAQKGAGFKTRADNNPLALGTDVLDISFYDETAVLFNMYVGWGINATNFKVVPSSGRVDIPQDVVEPSSPPPASQSSASDSGLSEAAKIGIGVGVGLGAAVTLIAGTALVLLYRKKRRKNSGSTANHKDSAPGSTDTASGQSACGDGGVVISSAGIRQAEEHGHGGGVALVMATKDVAEPHKADVKVLKSTAQGMDPSALHLWRQLYEGAHTPTMGSGTSVNLSQGLRRVSDVEASNNCARTSISVQENGAASGSSVDTNVCPMPAPAGLEAAPAGLEAAPGAATAPAVSRTVAAPAVASGALAAAAVAAAGAAAATPASMPAVAAGSSQTASLASGQSAPNTGASNPSWDPYREISQLANTLSSEGDKLTLLDAIGQGGFGTVYRGRWRNLEVAVKTVLFSDRLGVKDKQSAQPQQRAILEAAVCTSVMHPNVVITYHYDITSVTKGSGTKGLNGMTIDDSCGTTDWKLYLVQEYCNASLQDALRNQLLHNPSSLQPDLDLVLCILMDIARGMDYIHSKNIIHGDLTPGNVLLKQEQDSPIGVTGKITDFGLCTTIDPTKSHISNITNGTPFYVAPEVVSSGTLTKTSDVYSFGVLMWELYRCMPPWVKTDTGYTQNKRFRRFPADSPRVYVILCARCLDKNPKSRPVFADILKKLDVMHQAYLQGYDNLEFPSRKAGGDSRPRAQPAASQQVQLSAAAPATRASGNGGGTGAAPRSNTFQTYFVNQQDRSSRQDASVQQRKYEGHAQGEDTDGAMHVEQVEHA